MNEKKCVCVYKHKCKNDITSRRKHRRISLQPWEKERCLKEGTKGTKHKGKKQFSKFDFMKIKNFCSRKYTAKKMKDQATD